MIRLVALCLAVAFTATAADMREADALYKAGKWLPARQAYEQLLPQLEGNEKARVVSRLAYTYVRVGKKSKQALALYRQAETVPNAEPTQVAVSLLGIGESLRALGQNEEAIAELRRVGQLEGAHPNQVATAYLYVGWASNVIERTDDAIAAFRQVVAVKKSSGHLRARALNNIAILLERQKKYREALAAYKAVANEPGANRRQKEEAEMHLAELETLLAGDLPFYIRPVVMPVGHTTATVFWVSQGDIPAGSVTATAADTLSATAKAVRTAIKGTVCHRQAAELTGLAPGKTYEYTVRCGGKEQRGAFKTAPNDDQPVTFSVLGDTQNAPDLHAAVAKAISRDRPDFVLHVGDLTDRGSQWGRWRRELFAPAWPYLRQAAFWPAAGNHDGGSFFPTLFALRPKLYYSFDFAKVHVVVIDSYWSGGREQPRQLEWLEKDLAAAADAAWKIVSLHVPMVCSRRELKWFGFDEFRPILEKHGIDVVLAGHHPMYRRYLPMGQPGAKPILHITSGGGGPVGAPVPSPLLVASAGVSHHTTFRIRGSRLELTAVQPDGKVIDRLTLVKTDGRYQDEIMKTAIKPELARQIRHLYHEFVTDRTFKLMVDIDRKPEPGGPMQVLLDTARLPRGKLDLTGLPPDMAMILSAKKGSAWQSKAQARPLTDKVLAYDFTAPPDLEVGPKGFTPPLKLVMTLKVGDRVFEPYVCPTQLRIEAVHKLAGAADGLPLMWDFRLDPERVGDRQKWFAPDLDLTAWRKLLITQWWEDQLGRDYDGLGWYRTSAKVPAVGPGKRLWLEFGGIDESCWVYVNGKAAGHFIFNAAEDEESWQKPKVFDITALVKPGSNVFVVKVQDLFGKGGIYKGASLRVGK